MENGIYKIKVASPKGVQDAELNLNADGTVLNAELLMKGKPLPTDAGTINGDEIAFSGKLKTPVGKMDYDFAGKIDGTTLSGVMKTKKGDFPVKGVKA